MKKDVVWSSYFEDEERFADFVNCFGCDGVQYVQQKDVLPEDSKGHYKVWGDVFSKMRDVVRRVAFGVNFCIIGIENQENVDYGYPLREMNYTVATYEKQRRAIARKVRAFPGLRIGRSELLYRFRKTDRLKPTVTFVLYSGEEEWDGSLDLHGLLDFTDLPDALKNKVQNYSVNLIEIRKLSDEQLSELKTDLKQVLSFIKCSENKDALYRLVKSDAAYQTIDQEAFQVMSNYTHADQLIKQTEEHEEGERYNMCKAIDDLIEDGRIEGRMEGRMEGRVELIEKMLGKGKSAEDIADLCDLELEEVQQVAQGMVVR